ncbi:auxin-responsive protein IAA30 [Punica granatum]|uniref:Auxin-responsive protein n=1 Tax=Punica granatum TaxID=22663 RepID=A0A6P8CNC6_PUNGR|nr:auxin-responsive protein IAA30 [Punica granatum]
MGKGSNSSSSINSSNRMSRSSSGSSFSRSKRDLGTDLRLALGFSTSHQPNFSGDQWQQSEWAQDSSSEPLSNCDSSMMEVDESDNATFYVKVYMEGIPIGRKLDLLAHDGYYALITTLNYMFNTAILWSEEDGAQAEGCHVLTYEDKEGDWLMVGDVPWEMFLSSVKRLKVTRIG